MLCYLIYTLTVLVYFLSRKKQDIEGWLKAVLLVLYQIWGLLLLYGALFKHLNRTNYLISYLTITLAVIIIYNKRIRMNLLSFPGLIKAYIRQILIYPIAIFLLSLFIIITSYILLLAYIYPEQGIDSMSYHLPFVVTALQEGKIIPFSLPNYYSNLFPRHAELLLLSNALIEPDDTFFDFYQWFWFMLLLPSFYKLFTLLKIRKPYSIYGMFGVAFVPLIVMQGKSCYIDLIVFSIFALSLVFALSDCKGRFAGLSAGTLPSLKLTGVLFLAIIFIYRALLHKRKGIFSFILVSLLASSPWYLFNIYYYHNPIYPYPMPFMKNVLPSCERITYNVTQLDEYGLIMDKREGYLKKYNMDTSISYLITMFYKTSIDKAYLYTYDTFYGGFGPLWFCFLLPSIFLLSLFYRHKGVLQIAALSLLSLIAFLFIPLLDNSRFLLYLLIPGFASGLFIMQEVRTKAVSILLKALFLLLILSSFLFCYRTYPVFKIKSMLKEPAYKRHPSFNNNLQYKELMQGYALRVREGESTLICGGFYIYPLWHLEKHTKVEYLNPETPEFEFLHKLSTFKPRSVIVLRNSPFVKWLNPYGYTLWFEAENWVVYKR